RDGGGGFLAGLRGGGGFAAALGLGRGCRRFSNEFRGENAGHEQLGPMVVKIDSGAFGIRGGDDTQAVNLVLDGLPFLHYLHNFLLRPLADFWTCFHFWKGEAPAGRNLSNPTG